MTTANGVRGVLEDITTALQALQGQHGQIMDQDPQESDQSLCLLSNILDLHVQHMEELVVKGKALTGTVVELVE